MPISGTDDETSDGSSNGSSDGPSDESSNAGDPGRNVSVKDVASAAGVSVGTVSNVLNRPEKVSPSTLAHVQRVIEQLGFVRNDAARQLRAGTNRAVGMVVLDVRNPFFTDVARGVELRLGEHGRPLILGSSGQDERRESTYLDLFEEQRVSGLLISPVGRVLPRLRRLRERGTAVVVVDRRTGSREFSSVAVDDVHGGRMAVSHLVETGRRRIAFVGGPRGLTQIRHRLRGAEDVVARVDGATVRFLETATMDAEAGRRGAEELMAGSERPDAIFAANDLVALGVLQALTLAGVRVPDDVAIVGYDDIDFAASAAIPLSSVRQPREEMGQVATDLLLAAMDDPAAPVRDIVLEPELVVRRSTGG